MIKNYLKIAWRNLFKNKLHTSINLLGLVVGFTIGLGVLLLVYGQLTFDEAHTNKDRIYQAYQEYYREAGPEIGNVFGFPAGPTIKAECPSVERSSRFAFGSRQVQYADKEIDLTTMMVDEDFLNMFTIPVVQGAAQNGLKDPGGMILTEDAAKKVFGNEAAVGKTLKLMMGGQAKEMLVTAVVKNPERNSTVRFDALARIELRPDFTVDAQNWNNQHHAVYVMLKPGVPAAQTEKEMRQANRKILPDWYTGLEREGGRKDKNGDVFATRFMSLEEVHFTPRVSHSGSAVSRSQIYIMLALGAVIILIACFNFVNINLANAFGRSKEIGVRKCLGAAGNRLFAQLWTESFLLCAVAFVLSLVFIRLLIVYIQRENPSNLPLEDMLGRPAFLLVALALLLVVSFIAGGYPAWRLSRLEVVETLKGKVQLGGRSLLRSSLILLQFVIACVMISCTLIIYRQFNFLRKADLGFDKAYLISVPLSKPEKGFEMVQQLRTRLSGQPSVLSVSGSSINLGLGLDLSSSKTSSGWLYQGRDINTTTANVSHDYLKTVGIKTLAGADVDLSRIADTIPQVIFTESMAAQFTDKNLVGQRLVIDSSGPGWHVVGIIPDFHLYSMHQKKEALTLIVDKNSTLSYAFIKTNAANKQAAMELIKGTMAQLEPGRVFRGSFVDENIESWYKQEKMMSLVAAVAAAIAIILSCLGLLAMVMMLINQRVKEIGVRKVLGASVPQLALLVAKGFLGLIGLAILISIPLAYVLMQNWLQDFAYRQPITWWVFALVGAGALGMAVLTLGYHTIKAAWQNPVKSLRIE